MNINEIAEQAGVSRAAVSRYLNNGYVSEEKKERIRKVIEETGYRPSTQAQMLRTKKTKMIGVVLPKINSSSISRMVAGISEVLSENGYQMLLANTDNNIEEELNYLEVFKENYVDGIRLSRVAIGIFSVWVSGNRHIVEWYQTFHEKKHQREESDEHKNTEGRVQEAV